MNLKPTGIVDFRPDTSQVLAGPGFEDGDIEAMADAVGCGRDACESCADDSDPGAGEVGVGWWWRGRDESRDELLEELVEEFERVVDEVAKVGVRELEVVVATADCHAGGVVLFFFSLRRLNCWSVSVCKVGWKERMAHAHVSFRIRQLRKLPQVFGARPYVIG